MNYLHSYHAGNFADVFKHIILVSLIESLQSKENGFCYLDTHAGTGYYDLMSANAQKSKEYKQGIEKLLQQKRVPEPIRHYLNCVQKINSRLSQSIFASLRYYPGSPFIARHFLRSQDRMISSELHPQEYQTLKKNFLNDNQVSVQLLDGYRSLKAFLPPKERRGLILIDPPFERPHEFADLIRALPLALQRFETGVYAIWYPIKDRPPVERFHRALKEIVKRPILITELSLYPETSALHLNGCGMVIINPPYKFEGRLKGMLPWLRTALGIHRPKQTQLRML
jgi:23S rRNA (adenine2030-N6)-methyltransferase